VATGRRSAGGWRGATSSGSRGVPATNREAELSGILIVRVEAGAIAEIWHAEDMLGLLDRIGAKPEVTVEG
jgi:hypothetical protein